MQYFWSDELKENLKIGGLAEKIHGILLDEESLFNFRKRNLTNLLESGNFLICYNSDIVGFVQVQEAPARAGSLFKSYTQEPWLALLSFYVNEPYISTVGVDLIQGVCQRYNEHTLFMETICPEVSDSLEENGFELAMNHLGFTGVADSGSIYSHLFGYLMKQGVCRIFQYTLDFVCGDPKL